MSEKAPIMEMKKINSGKLRSIGYDARARILQVQLDNGSTLQYGGVGEDIWRRGFASKAANTSPRRGRRAAACWWPPLISVTGS